MLLRFMWWPARLVTASHRHATAHGKGCQLAHSKAQQHWLHEPAPASCMLCPCPPTCAASCFCGDAGAAAAAATAELRPAASCTCCCWMSVTSRFSASRARSSHCKADREWCSWQQVSRRVTAWGCWASQDGHNVLFLCTSAATLHPF